MRKRRNVDTLAFARAGHGRIGTRAIAAYQGLLRQVELTTRGSRLRRLHSCIVTLGSCVVKGTTRTARASRAVPGCTRHSEVISRRSRPIHTSFQLLGIHRTRCGLSLRSTVRKSRDRSACALASDGRTHGVARSGTESRTFRSALVWGHPSHRSDAAARRRWTQGDALASARNAAAHEPKNWHRTGTSNQLQK